MESLYSWGSLRSWGPGEAGASFFSVVAFGAGDDWGSLDGEGGEGVVSSQGGNDGGGVVAAGLENKRVCGKVHTEAHLDVVASGGECDGGVNGHVCHGDVDVAGVSGPGWVEAQIAGVSGA